MDQTSRDIRDLIKILQHYTDLYNKGVPAITDKEWDDLYFKLTNLEKETGIIYPDSPTQSIHYETKSELAKKTHEYKPMLSLEKTKEVSELENFLYKDPKEWDWCAMFKLDGLSCRLTYENGKLISAETRGNGIEGEDITHNAKIMPSIPNQIPYKETLVVDGEVICDLKTFNKYFSKDYKNARNLASGSIRLLSAEDSASRKLTFVAWDMIKGYSDIDFFFWRLEKLDDLGFITVPRIGDAETVSDAIESLKEDIEYYEYPVDGLVFRFESQRYYDSLGNTDHHFKGAIAFKFYDEDYETELLNIELSIGRTGVLTPVAIFKPIDIEGSTVERASLHNLSVMNNTLGTHPYVGQKVKVAKMNMIIPQITWADTDENNIDWDNLIKTTCCPVCGGSLEVEDNNGVITLWCANPNCEGKLVQRLDHFCGKKGLDIKGISRATLEKLIEWGWINDSITELFNLSSHRGDWINKPSFGTASVDKILSAIESGKRTTLDAFLAAIGIPLVGKTVAKEIVKYYDTWEEFRNAVGGDWTTFDGFGPEISKAINTFDYTEADKCAGMLTFIQPEIQNEVAPAAAIKDKVFVITGKVTHYKNRDELKAEIEALGGKVASSITSKTNYLINNDITSTSAKNKAAKANNIPIITEEEYISMKS